LKAYDAKEYARAIESFEAAHKLSRLPEILFDIAMAHRALGDCRRAAEGFEAFIAAAPTDDPLLARARARRADLGSCAAASGDDGATKTAAAEYPPVAPLAVEPSPNAPGLPTLIASAETAPPPQRPRLWLRNTCAGSLTGTGLLGVGALVFGWQARSAQAEAESAVIWDDAAVRADERGRTYGQIATTLLISAGVTAAIAAVSCVATTRSR